MEKLFVSLVLPQKPTISFIYMNRPWKFGQEHVVKEFRTLEGIMKRLKRKLRLRSLAAKHLAVNQEIEGSIPFVTV